MQKYSFMLGNWQTVLIKIEGSKLEAFKNETLLYQNKDIRELLEQEQSFKFENRTLYIRVEQNPSGQIIPLLWDNDVQLQPQDKIIQLPSEEDLKREKTKVRAATVAPPSTTEKALLGGIGIAGIIALVICSPFLLWALYWFCIIVYYIFSFLLWGFFESFR